MNDKNFTYPSVIVLSFLFLFLFFFKFFLFFHFSFFLSLKKKLIIISSIRHNCYPGFSTSLPDPQTPRPPPQPQNPLFLPPSRKYEWPSLPSTLELSCRRQGLEEPREIRCLGNTRMVLAVPKANRRAESMLPCPSGHYRCSDESVL